MRLAVCADLGSTWTKALLVGLDGADAGRVLATAAHPTTLPGPERPGADLVDGYDACLAALLAARPDARVALAGGRLEQHACSSAGGGLRIAVVGNEALVTAEAGRRVALSSGGRVVAVHALADAPGLTGGPDVAPALAARPDVVLLVGGTDGGNPEPLVAGATALVAGGWRGPVV
ncbi:glutamate mutase L, partial [Nocardioides sp. ChNu-99]|uniref:glutamate mutase L n=1 Tax=Nocardioides sp. ChNu-99 TaxID=2839897 RepID=UPI002406516D